MTEILFYKLDSFFQKCFVALIGSEMKKKVKIELI